MELHYVLVSRTAVKSTLLPFIFAPDPRHAARTFELGFNHPLALAGCRMQKERKRTLYRPRGNSRGDLSGIGLPLRFLKPPTSRKPWVNLSKRPSQKQEKNAILEI